MQAMLDIMERGGIVMWPLLIASLVSITLSVERLIYFTALNTPGMMRRFGEAGAALRRGDGDEARKAMGTTGVYGRFVSKLVSERVTEASAAQAAEAERHRLERFLPTLSTIITGAPMLGILGTVIGIISAFGDLSADTRPDLGQIGGDIGMALISTAAGLVVALITLVPYNALRVQSDRTLGRLETLAASAMTGSRPG